jgi:chorismate mutase
MDEKSADVAEMRADNGSPLTDEERTEVVITRETMWAWAAEEAA